LHALTSLPPSQSQPSLLILAHKSDLLKTGSSSHTNAATLAVNRVKTILERELEKRRLSQRGGINIEGLGEEGERSDMGGLECGEKEGSIFKFDDWEGGDVTFLGTSTGAQRVTIGREDRWRERLGPLAGVDRKPFLIPQSYMYFRSLRLIACQARTNKTAYIVFFFCHEGFLTATS